MAVRKHINIRHLGRVDYLPAWEAMRRFTEERTAETQDEIWFLEHPPVFTLGLGGRQEHLLDPGDIPVVHTDRGGQVTYHGPGQLIVYVLMDLHRRGWGVRRLVRALEQSVIELCGEFRVTAVRRPGAPGVYVDESKLASLGLRVRRGSTYHGLALNVDMDLAPFRRINPCGYPGLAVTQTRDQGIRGGVEEIRQRLLPYLLVQLGYDSTTGTSSATVRAPL